MMPTLPTQGALRVPRFGSRAPACAWRGAALSTFLAVACGGAPAPGSKAAPEAGTTAAPPRVLQVQDDSLALEGHWSPLEVGTRSPVVQNAMRVVYTRAERSCNENLTTFSPDAGAESVHHALEYRVTERTKPGKPAGKVIASRREGTTEIEIRVSLSGLAAEKVVVAKGIETRWRLE